jgi:hypothetical protein
LKLTGKVFVVTKDSETIRVDKLASENQYAAVETPPHQVLSRQQ